MINNKKNKGSVWRIWDLHVHTPATYGGDFGTFISNVSNSKAEVIGLNDYCSLKGYKKVIELGGITGKVVFPVVEFRMHNIVANRKNADPTKAGIKINFHIIFDDKPELFTVIDNWLNSLECFNEKGETVQLGTATELMKVSFDFEHVLASLTKLNLLKKHCLVWLPYDEYGGIDDIDPSDNFFKLSLINKSHILGSSTKKQIEFFKWEDQKFSKEKYKAWFDKPKPCIKGSDAHKIDYPFGYLRNHLSDPIEKHCWINADMTFKGLKQILIEPDRVFIGDEPDIIKRVRTNKTKFIRSLSVKKLDDALVEDTWFYNFHLELNSGLVAIIGNKGGGKSAITDIISLCGNTHQNPSNFSFLNSSKFRKIKPYNLSERFQGTLIWEDGTIVSKKLNENPDLNLPERVKYIPQNFLERLCTNVESDDFEKELKQIIYSHTPNDKKLGKSSLDELINYKSSLVNAEIAEIQSQVSSLNLIIVSLENKTTSDYKKTIKNQLELKKGELTAHSTIKPQKPKEGQESEESKKLVEKLTTIREQIKSLEEEIEGLKIERSGLSIRKEELDRTNQFFKNLDEQLRKYEDKENEFVKILTKNGIEQSDIFTYKIDTTKIVDLINEVELKISEINDKLNNDIKESKTNLLQKLNTELKQGQEVLDKPAKEHQKYLDDLKNWDAKKKEIEGDSSKEGSLKYYEYQVKYLNDQLIPELKVRYNERKSLIEDLYSKKLSLIKIRKELFQPVTQFIDDFEELKKRYDVKIDVALELRSFVDSFFNFVNQGRSGTFCGREEGYKRLMDLIEKTHFDTKEGFSQFTEDLINYLKFDKRTIANTEVDINTQLKKGIELNQLYDYIYNSDYLQPAYNLKLGNKTLQELSPGERGALLLIFYLILDNDDIPLIIDQPEENLDNESVYHILVHFIKKVKEKRQIIIVTHNPNLAIVCDADQIINMIIEKENKNTVKFYSGAIENDTINKAIVNILEGTLPAFNNRDAKYYR